MQKFWLILGTVLLITAVSVSIETSVFWNFILKVACLGGFFWVTRQIDVDLNTDKEL